jgi:hypothetical protein
MFGPLPHASTEIVEKLRELCLRSGATLEEGCLAFNAAISEQLDPLKPEARGELWVFDCERPPETVSGNDVGALRLVPRLGVAPPANADCNLVAAYRQHSLDLKAARELLALNPPLDVLTRVCVNQHDWAAFWSVRGDAGMREKFRVRFCDRRILRNQRLSRGLR